MSRQFRSDDPERKQWQDPEKILPAIGLAPGKVFVDMGCGDGYFALPAARIVGTKGKVYAADINADAICRLRESAEKAGLTNVIAQASPVEDTIFCHGCADIVFFGIDLHDFDDPEQVCRNAAVMLKPSGILVDLDWKDQPTPMGPPLQKRFSIEKAQGLIESAGLRVRSVSDCGPYHYLIVAGK